MPGKYAWHHYYCAFLFHADARIAACIRRGNGGSIKQNYDS